MESYQPVFDLLTKLATQPLLTPAQTPSQAVVTSSCDTRSRSGAEAADLEAARLENEVIDEVGRFVAPSLSQQAIRLLVAVVTGHGVANVVVSIPSVISL